MPAWGCTLEGREEEEEEEEERESLRRSLEEESLWEEEESEGLVQRDEEDDDLTLGREIGDESVSSSSAKLRSFIGGFLAVVEVATVGFEADLVLAVEV